MLQALQKEKNVEYVDVWKTLPPQSRRYLGGHSNHLTIKGNEILSLLFRISRAYLWNRNLDNESIIWLTISNLSDMIPSPHLLGTKSEEPPPEEKDISLALWLWRACSSSKEIVVFPPFLSPVALLHWYSYFSIVLSILLPLFMSPSKIFFSTSLILLSGCMMTCLTEPDLVRSATSSTRRWCHNPTSYTRWNPALRSTINLLQTRERPHPLRSTRYANRASYTEGPLTKPPLGNR